MEKEQLQLEAKDKRVKAVELKMPVTIKSNQDILFSLSAYVRSTGQVS